MDNEVKAKMIIENIISQFADFYNGDNWVSQNFKERILSLSEDIAQRKTNNHSHNIEQITAHIIAWRNFGVQKLTGNNAFDIEDNSIHDWPATSNWSSVQSEFDVMHRKLIHGIQNFPLHKWSETVPLRSYSFFYLVNGILQHDYYHYGQIASLLAAMS